MTGAGFVIGPLLICCAFGVTAAQAIVKPEHYVVAGIAILWLAVAGIIDTFK